MEAKELYGSLSKAAGTKLGELKDKTDTLLRTKKVTLKNGTFITAREVYFAIINTLEINKQLDPSLLDLDQGIYELKDPTKNETEPKDLDKS
ncbi:uncharacterized protein N7503_006537 [Penicillium pulvis]|uniref:uncharacterized protein n=1 Tax=Penicillium pulvis TaxID=1562058 RepID=UPI002546C737|nr:uncharacterized protein N7503_006537 [Penicillium pulvis]KAJ5799032.1 hypothetical protein N7503_006537 [Penicillium pulvis]